MEEALAVSVRPYPWDGLKRYRREDICALRRFRVAARSAVDPARILQNLGELLGVHAEVLEFAYEIERGEPPRETGFAITLETSPAGVRIALELERDLVAWVVSSVLGRPSPLVDPRAPLDPTLAGAAAAIVARIARRSPAERLLTPLGPGGLSPQPGEPRAVVQATLLLGQSAFRIRATLYASVHDVLPRPPALEALRRLGDLPLTLEVVAAVSAATRADIDSLGVGDVWLPGAGWTAKIIGQSPPVGEVVLAARQSEYALAASLASPSEIVLGTARRLPFDQECQDCDMARETTPNTERAEGGGEDAVDAAGLSAADAVVDAPVVVRVEVSAVTLSAREWAGTMPGDLLPLSRPLGSLVSLRVAGLEVARGELVDIEGELGVRIRELVGR